MQLITASDSKPTGLYVRERRMKGYAEKFEACIGFMFPNPLTQEEMSLNS
jgi:hypothetical protein